MTMKAADPFAALPVRSPYVEARADAAGCLQIRHSPPRRGLRGLVARYISFLPIRRILLDEKGSFFWNLIDGQHTLADIEKELRGRYALEAHQSRDSVILFTKMLMRRGLIGLRLPHSSRKVRL